PPAAPSPRQARTRATCRVLVSLPEQEAVVRRSGWTRQRRIGMPVDKDLVGREGIAVVLVTPDITADALGNPGLHVFATPALVALFERAAIAALTGSLGPGEASVGNVVRVTHRAPTPLGGTVTARARVRAVEGSGVWFDLEAHDDA